MLRAYESLHHHSKHSALAQPSVPTVLSKTRCNGFIMLLTNKEGATILAVEL